MQLYKVRFKAACKDAGDLHFVNSYTGTVRSCIADVLADTAEDAVRVLKSSLSEGDHARVLEVLNVEAQDMPRVADVSWGDLLEVDDKYLSLFSGSKCKFPTQNVHKTGKSLRHRPVPRP